MTTAAIALGSNLGDRTAHLQHAIGRLEAFIRSLQVSAFIETDPVASSPQPRYLNGAAVGQTDMPPTDLLGKLQQIERERGRERPFPDAPRTLDLDLVLYGSEILDVPGLTVPHPRFRERRFVLEPLVSIAPELVDPVTGLTVRELLGRIGGARSVVP